MSTIRRRNPTSGVVDAYEQARASQISLTMIVFSVGLVIAVIVGCLWMTPNLELMANTIPTKP